MKIYIFFTVFSLVAFSLQSADDYSADTTYHPFDSTIDYSLTPKLHATPSPIIQRVEDDFFSTLQSQSRCITPDDFEGLGALYFKENVYMFGYIGNDQESDAAIFKFDEAPLEVKPKLNILFGKGGIFNLNKTLCLEEKNGDKIIKFTNLGF